LEKRALINFRGLDCILLNWTGDRLLLYFLQIESRFAAFCPQREPKVSWRGQIDVKYIQRILKLFFFTLNLEAVQKRFVKL